MEYKCLIYEVEENIATLTMNRPERLNVLGDTLRQDLHDAITKASSDSDVRAIILTGAGRGFCSGGDVKAMNEAKQRNQSAPIMDKIAPSRDLTVLAMRDAPKPVIAAVNGPAAGAGMNIALACDIRLASSAARFGETFVKRGLHVDWGGTYFLPRIVGMAKACELIFSGDVINAQEALALGIVSQVVEPNALMDTVRALARKMAAGPPIVIRLAKRALYHNQECDLRAALEYKTYAQNICREMEDAREGIRAFVEKRPPHFKGH
ncbi:enoyl-CoA hydratase/isomerase family protein [Candidatus Entotheonella serta]|nr:enoyl-CoA hydratase/isomerase family protein [Candidatus Entotheonella serta]